MKTKRKIVFPALLLCALLLVPALTLYGLVKGPAGWSAEENRALASAPQVSLRSLWDGTLAQDAEGFYKDHMFARRLLLKLDTAVQMKLLRKPVVHDVVLGDTALLPAPGFSAKRLDAELQKDAEHVAEGLRSVKAAADKVGAKLLYTLVPEQRTVFSAYYPDWMENPAEDTARNRAALLSALEKAEIPVLDLTGTFASLPDALTRYSRVDHHYTLKGAYLTYQAICEAFGLRASELTVIDAQTGLFGTYNRKLYDLSPVREAMQVLEDAFPAYERFDNGKPSDTPLIRSQTDSRGLYTDYMGGDIAETIVRTNREELPNILIVGDSFTNALEPLAVFDFGEMRSLDYRHYAGAALSEYILEYEPAFVVVVRDDVSCLGPGGNGALE